jgi:hypothetical protein
MALVAEWQPLGLMEVSAKRTFPKTRIVTASARTLMNWLRLFALAFLLESIAQAQSYEAFDYKSGFNTIQTLGHDIYTSLEPAERAIISSQPISLDTSRKPFIRLLYYRDESETIRGVWVSQGMIDLVNQLAHAKAIDKQRRGYFSSYLKLLEGSENSIPPLPDRENPAYWTDTLLNEQLSNFNSIIGILVGVNLAQHYLGLPQKYEKELRVEELDGIPLNKRITADEWEQSYRRGLNNAMLASCMTEGYLPICEGLSDMKHRPAWANYFYPDTIRFESMRKDMVKLQRKFLND